MRMTLTVLACCLWLSGCAGWEVREPLSVTIAGFAPIEVGVLEQRYDIKLRLLNPNTTEIAFDGAVFELEINGESFARGVSDQKGVVPRFGEAVIEGKAVSGLGSILRQVVGIQRGELAGLSYRIKGRLHPPEGIWPVLFESSGEFAFPAGNKPGG